eukprot:4082389-Alexandrium_andersonii.AAC.1
MVAGGDSGHPEDSVKGGIPALIGILLRLRLIVNHSGPPPKSLGKVFPVRTIIQVGTEHPRARAESFL